MKVPLYVLTFQVWVSSFIKFEIKIVNSICDIISCLFRITFPNLISL